VTISGSEDRTPRTAAKLAKALTTTGLVAALTVIVLAIVAVPGSVLDKARWVDYDICSQLPAHNFFFNG